MGYFTLFQENRRKKRDSAKLLNPFYFLAQRRGFEPPDTFPHHTISNRAP